MYSSTRAWPGGVAFLQLIPAFKCRLTVIRRNKMVDNTKRKYKIDKRAEISLYVLK
jgi:hypothetical protein